MLTTTIGGQALESWAIEDHMGYRMIKGEELMQKFEEQVRTLDVRLELDRVTTVAADGDRFQATTEGGRTHTATSLLIASGKLPRKLGVADEQKYIGRGLSVCATRDGPLFRDMRIAVVGGGNMAVQMAIEMAGYAERVDLVIRSKLKADEASLERLAQKETINIQKGDEVTAHHGDGFLTGMTVRERATGAGIRLDLDGVFTEIGWRSNTEFLGGLLELGPRGPDRRGRELPHPAARGVRGRRRHEHPFGPDHPRLGRGRKSRERDLRPSLCALMRQCDRGPIALSPEMVLGFVAG